MSHLYWDPPREIFTLPVIDHPITFYGLFFATGVAVGYYIFRRLLARYLSPMPSQQVQKIAESFSFHVVIATVIGARLGHFLFYQSPSSYLSQPWVIFQVWKGGLASHGAAVAIAIAIYLFSKKVKGLSWMVLFDLIATPAAFTAGCIRLGNFFNQEILGNPTTVPWAILFGNPLDGSLAVPRHPVQLYESVAYFVTFGVLLLLARKPEVFSQRGRMIGTLFLLVFVSRFFIEFWKMEQSAFWNLSLTMGQLLSIPFIAAGIWCLRKRPSLS